MRRRSNSQPLAIWANGELLGHWSPSSRRPMELRYEDSWLASRAARPLSLSLPLPLVGNEPLRGERVEYFFDNLLPDSGTIRRRLAQRYSAGSEDSFDLLAAVGRDCAGAVQLLPADEAPTGFDRIEGEVLDDEAVAALLRHDGKWLRPLGATPTTHIVKLPMGLVGNMQADMRTSVYNEWLCLTFMRELGFDVAQTDIVTFADHTPVLVVERFDRKRHPSGTWILRIPQEDFCQALGVSPAKKYEADGGPGVERLAMVLSGSQSAGADLRTLLASQVVFSLLAATDGHAKNFSIRLQAGGAYALTPLYDVLSAWPIIGSGKNQLAWRNAKLAMAVSGKNRHYELATIMRHHFNATAAKCGWGANAEDILGELLARVEPAIAAATRQMPVDFPQDVAEAVFEGVRKQVQRLQFQPCT